MLKTKKYLKFFIIFLLVLILIFIFRDEIGTIVKNLRSNIFKDILITKTI